MQLSNITSPVQTYHNAAEGWASIDTSVSELCAHTPAESAVIDMQWAAQHEATKVSRYAGENGCPSCTKITLPNGRIICVYDESTEDDTKAHVQVFETTSQYEEGDHSLSIDI